MQKGLTEAEKNACLSESAALKSWLYVPQTFSIIPQEWNYCLWLRGQFMVFKKVKKRTESWKPLIVPLEFFLTVQATAAEIKSCFLYEKLHLTEDDTHSWQSGGICTLSIKLSNSNTVISLHFFFLNKVKRALFCFPKGCEAIRSYLLVSQSTLEWEVL